MTSKNNQVDRLAKEMPLTQRYALRKLSVGVASVLLGTTIAMGINGKVVHADTSVSSVDQSAEANANVPAIMGKTATLPATTQNPASQAAVNDDSAVSAADQVVAVKPVDPNAYTITNVKATSVAGNGQEKTGETQLSFDMGLNFNDHQIKKGDYIDVSMGLPYKANADSQERVLAYGGAAETKATPISITYKTTDGDEEHTAVVGEVQLTGNGDNSYTVSYHETPTADVDNVVWKKNNNYNELTSNGIGASNDGYRIIFNDTLEKIRKQYADHNLTDAKMSFKLAWKNLSGFDLDKAPLDSKYFHLYSSNDKATTIVPTNDIKIGDQSFTSGLKIKVNGKVNDADNFNKKIIPVSSTKFAAHTWYFDKKANKWGTGDEVIRDPWQTEAVQLATKNNGYELGKDFTITVTKPENQAGLIEYYFIGNDDLKSALMKSIVVKHHNYDLDPVDGQKGVYVTRTMVSSTVPDIDVTSDDSNNGLTRTYHVKINGDYLGFNRDKDISLINWKPVHAEDMLEPANITSPITNEEAKTHPANEDVIKHINQYEGVALRNPDLQKYLEDHPWHLTVTNNQNQQLYDSDAGYYVQYYTYRNGENSSSGILTGKIDNVQNKQVTETIYYKYLGTDKEAAPTYKTRTGFVQYNRNGEWQDWTPGQSTFARVENPVVVGYHAVDKDGKPVSAVHEINVNHDSNNIEITIYYAADPQRLTYTVIDEDTGKNLETTVDLADGKSNEPIPSDTAGKYKGVQDKYVSEGYYLSKDPDALPANFDNNTDVDQNVNIYVRKRNSMKEETVSHIRTITYYDKLTGKQINITGKTDPVKQTVSFKRYAVYSGVDGSLLGYTTTKKTDEHGNYLIDVTPDKDVTAWEVSEGGWPASTNPDLSYFGYQPAEDVDGNDFPTVQEEHPTATTADEDVKVYYEPRIKNGEETATSKRTIHYVYANGPREGKVAAPDAIQVVTYTRTTTTNEVTNKTTYGDWQPTSSVTTVDGNESENNELGSFAKVVSPTIKDYTPDQESVASVIAQEGADPIEITVNYTTEPHQITYTVIDDVTGLKLDNNKFLTKGFADTKLPVSATTTYKDVVKHYLDMGYTLVSEDDVPTVFADHDQNLVVHLTHGTKDVTESHAVHEDIKYRYVDGNEAAPTYNADPITFTRTGTTDLVTNKTVWGTWTPTSDSFTAVESPVIPGYSTETPEIAEQPVTPTTADLHFIVLYTKNKPVVPHPETPKNSETPDTPTPGSSASSASSAPASSASSVTSNPTPADSTASQTPTPTPSETPTVAEPAVSQPAPVTPHAAIEETVVNHNTVSQKPSQKTLPQTGNQHQSIWHVILAAFLGLFGITLGAKRKKN